MPDIGFNDNVVVGKRIFHVQTATNKAKGVVRCEIFEKGRLITAQTFHYERRKSEQAHTAEDHVKNFVKDVHQATIDEIHFLFKVADRINKAPNVNALLKLGTLFLKHNLISDAIRTFKKVLEIDPKCNRALILLASTYTKLNRNDEAINLLNRVVKSGYNYADVFNQLALAYSNKHNHVKALNYYQEALRINPNYGEAQYNTAVTYLESILTQKESSYLPPPSIRIDRARQLLRKVKNSNPLFTDEQYLAVEQSIDRSEFEEAIRLLVNLRERLFPQDTSSLISTSFYLKFMYDGVNLTEREIKQYEQELKEAIKVRPEYADLWNSLGVVHLIQCRNLFLQALNEFDRALEINPSYEKAMKNKKLVENDGKEFLILLRAILK
ncbi:tetratricopeptide repeat protein [Caldithrix abyssi]